MTEAFNKEYKAHHEALIERDKYMKRYKDGKKEIKKLRGEFQNKETQFKVDEQELIEAREQVSDQSEKLKIALSEKESNLKETEERVARRDKKIDKLTKKVKEALENEQILKKKYEENYQIIETIAENASGLEAKLEESKLNKIAKQKV